MSPPEVSSTRPAPQDASQNAAQGASPDVAVIGGGPAGLMAAEILAQGGARVTVYDRMANVGRKLLLAGRGGLNLTHAEDFDTFLTRYGAAEPHLRAALQALSPANLRAWCEGLGQETFVGSSGRVFPRAMKASPLLRAWLRRLAAQRVRLVSRHTFRGFAGDALVFDTPAGHVQVTPAATVLALGGASWPKLGSDGTWVPLFAEAGIGVSPLKPANCGFLVDWSAHLRERFAGTPLKRIALCHDGRKVRGEAMVSATGLEGGAVYALSAALRDAIEARGPTTLTIDLRPDHDAAALARRLSAPRGKASLSTYLRKTLALAPVEIALLHETTPGLAALAAAALAARIKAVPLTLTAPAPLARAISTAGGVAFAGLDPHFMLRQRPGTFLAGEMLDWEAPTGGYLLQACFATGAAAGRGALAWLARSGWSCPVEPVG